ncbi:MAG: hypothetical protein A2020_08700 [Lentisphaerae bacterium GWF2_45_14]|nr:MAG: hypothetical protein A2020_08700 [Lentisphaerae bacterium GWF2_45_14]
MLPSLFFAAERNARVTPIVEAVSGILPSVVNISAGTEKAESKSSSESRVLGSGCIVDQTGLVLTNSHVIEGAERLNITLSDGRTFTASIVADDPANDLALLKIVTEYQKDSWGAVKMAEPGDLLLGETVIMAGNPYGLGSSISAGILGAIGRKVVYKGKIVFNDILQVDAPIYPGNSGGPLINLNGEMIGISTAVHRNAPGIGFAIPIMRIENVLASWMLPEKFKRAKLGFVPAVRKPNGKPEIYIYSVEKKSPAWEAGIRGGEVLKTFDGKEIKSLIELSRELMRLRVGNTVKLTDTENRSFSISLVPAGVNDGAGVAKELLNISIQEMSPRLADALGFSGLLGVVVSDSFGAGSKIKRGTLITAIDGMPVKNFFDVAEALRDNVSGDKIKLSTVSEESGKKEFWVYAK